MSHYTNISTGRYVMTEANALRHFIKEAKKALKTNNVDKMRTVYNEATYHINVDFCLKCLHDDFGYCEYRGQNSINPDEHFKICFTNWIKVMGYELNSLLNKKGKQNG